jgi:hypothetical protein
MNIQSAAGNLWSIGAQNDGMGVYNRTSSLYAFFIKDNRQLQLPSYTASSSYTGTAAGYLAFDSSGNVITVAGVAATDNTKLPLTGGALTGPLTITGNGSYLGDWGYKTLELNDTSGYAGIFFKNGNNIWINRRNGADNAMDWAYSTNASAQGTGTFAQKMRLASDEWWVSTYPGYKLQVTGGDQINVTNAGNATTLYLQYQGGVGAALNIAAGKYTLDNSGNGSASSSWRAPIFYDSNDTGYYGDFNGTSSLWGLAIRGDNGASSTANQIFFWGTGNTTTSAIGFKSNAAPFANPTGAGDGYNTYFTMDTPGRGWVFRRGTGGSDFSAAYTAGWILNNGIWQANSEMRAPVFRFTNSSNNAYLTGNSDWGFRVVNDSGYIQFGPANGSWAHIYSGLPFYFNQALYVNGTQVVTNSGTWGINVTGTANNITAYTINQSVGTGNAPTFADVYTNGWFRNNTNNAGLYSQANNVHFSSSSDGRWNIGSGGRTNGALVFYQDHMTTLKGYVYWDGSGFGLLNNQGGWSVLAYQGTSYGGELRGSWYTTGNITTGGKISNGSVWINNGADYNSYNENIRLFAAPNGVSVIAFNASGISGTPAGGSILGFDDRLEIRKGGDAWQLRAYSGYVEASGSFRAPIFYDSNDTGYYLDPNGESNLWRFTAQSMTRNAINYLSINSPVNTRAGQSGPYLNGTMGWGNTDFNTIFSNWGSGFIDTWSSPSNAPGGSSHYVGLQGLHYNHQNGTNGYGFQMACAGEADNRFFWRSSWATPRSWVEMIHSGNIGSQSVNYASSTPWSGVTSKPGNITYWDTWYGSSYLGSNGNLYMGWAGAWLDGWLNQNVKSNAGPTFQTVYLNDWCRVRYETGVYFESYDAGLRSAYQASFGQVATYGTARSAHGGYIIVNNYITNLMQDTSGNFGFFSNNDWAWRLFYNRGNNCWGIGTDNTYSGDGFRCVKYGSAEYGWTTWSDRRAKENISTISGALDKVLSMRGVYYNYIKDETKSQHVGFIAQELIDVLPQSVRYAEEIDEYNINYGPIVSILAEAIKEQDIKMKIQEDKISLLQAQLQTLLN